MHILIVYGTLEGQTKKIAEYIADKIRKRGHQVTVHLGSSLPTLYSTDGFDAAIIGGSVHMGDYPDCMNQFVMTHSSWLKAVPAAFFTVCLGVISKHEKTRKEADHYSEDFLKNIGWEPDLNETFPGAIKYSKYNFLTRMVMKFIVKHEGLSDDTSHDHEYTNWADVTQFTEQFLIAAEKAVPVARTG